jgi:DNA-binding MarR family transcriptional regulator
MRRAIDPHLVDSQDRARFRVIDHLEALGYIHLTTRARGNRRALWVNITSAGERALAR